MRIAATISNRPAATLSLRRIDRGREGREHGSAGTHHLSGPAVSAIATSALERRPAPGRSYQGVIGSEIDRGPRSIIARNESPAPL